MKTILKFVPVVESTSTSDAQLVPGKSYDVTYEGNTHSTRVVITQVIVEGDKQCFFGKVASQRIMDFVKPYTSGWVKPFELTGEIEFHENEALAISQLQQLQVA